MSQVPTRLCSPKPSIPGADLAPRAQTGNYAALGRGRWEWGDAEPGTPGWEVWVWGERGAGRGGGARRRLSLQQVGLGGQGWLSTACLPSGLCEGRPLSVAGNLGAPGPWSPDGQFRGSPGSAACEGSAPRPPCPPRRVTVPYCCLTGPLRSRGFHGSSVGEGRGGKKPRVSPNPLSFPKRHPPPPHFTKKVLDENIHLVW